MSLLGVMRFRPPYPIVSRAVPVEQQCRESGRHLYAVCATVPRLLRSARSERSVALATQPHQAV